IVDRVLAALLLAARLVGDPSAPRATEDEAAITAATAPTELRHYTLDNGLDVVLEVDRRQPLVAVVMTYDVGLRDGPPARRQLAHVVEHLMFEGSRHVSRDRRDDALFRA